MVMTGPGLDLEENREDGKVGGKVKDVLLALESGERQPGSEQGSGGRKGIGSPWALA